VRGCYPHAQPQSWRATPCHLPATAYSIYLQLTSIAGGRSIIRNPRTRHAVGTGTPPNMVSVPSMKTKAKLKGTCKMSCRNWETSVIQINHLSYTVLEVTMSGTLGIFPFLINSKTKYPLDISHDLLSMEQPVHSPQPKKNNILSPRRILICLVVLMLLPVRVFVRL
jgi:hypothetical protein